MRPPCKFSRRDSALAAGDLAGLEATGADVGLALVAVDDDGDALDVRLERTVDDAVGVADAATGHGVLTANFTNLGHFSHSITSDNL